MNKYKSLDSLFEQEEMRNFERTRRRNRRDRQGSKGKSFGGWVVKGNRPEETCGSPENYYNSEEVERYSRIGGIRRTQEKLAYRILDLLKIPEGARFLDLGCGPGFSMTAYQNKGYRVIGIDMLAEMLAKAREKGLEVVEGDMRALQEHFQAATFDVVVSASALQWIKSKADMLAVAKGVYYVLKPKGKIGIQFYPKSQEELELFASAFVESGFEGDIVTDNPDNPVKRTIYLVMKKL